MAITSMMQSTMETLASVQTEIAIFLTAVVLHYFVFSKYRFTAKKGGAKGSSAAKRGNVGNNKINKSQNTTPPLAQAPEVLDLLRQVKPLVREEAQQEQIAQVLSEQLAKKTKEEAISSLSGLLEALGKAATPAVLSAVHHTLRARDFCPDNRLAEALMRGFLFHKNFEEFSEVLCEVEGAIEKGASVAPGVAILALRAKIISSDFEGALCRISSVAANWRQQAQRTPSAAPQQLVQNLLQLATEKEGQVARLLEALCEHDLVTPWMVETVLGYCAKRAEEQPSALEAFEKTLELARTLGVELTPGSRAALIRRSKSAEEARKLLAEAPSHSSDVLTVAAEIAKAYGDVVLADDILRMMPEKPTLELAATALKLPRTGDVETAVLKLYEERFAGVVDILADNSAGLLVAEAALHQGRDDLLKKLFMMSPESPRQVALLKHFCGSLGLESAHKVFKACTVKTSYLYNALLDACIETDNVKAAELIMKEATGSGLADVITYNTIIKAQLRHGDTQKARKTIETMRCAGLEPNVVTFNELIDETLKHSRNGAWDVIEEMKASGLQPNQVTCSIILKHIQKNSRTSDIERTLAIIDNLGGGLDEVLLSSICEACIRAGAFNILREQLRQHCQSNVVKVQGPHTFGSIIRAYGYVKDMAGVWQSWKQMRSRHIVPTSITLGCMVEALVTNEGPEAGYSLICEVLEDEPMRPLLNAVIYCSVLKGFSHEKRFDRFWGVHQDMVRERLEFSITTYNTLIDACARSCDMVRVPKFLEEMERLGIEPNVITYSTILKGYCQENRLDNAFELLEDMKSTKQLMPDEITYNTLLDGCARHGLYDRGLAVLKDMQAGGVRPSNFTLSVLVKLANRANKPGMAFELCKDLSRKYNLVLNIHVYNNLMHACTQHGDLPRAMTVFQQLLQERVRPDARSYRVLIQGCTSAGDGKGAADLLRAAAGLAQDNPKLAGIGLSAMRLSESLPGALVSEILEDIAGKCGDEGLAVQLLQDLKRVPGIRLNPGSAMSLTNKAIRARR